MKFVHSWLQSFFKEKLPSPEKLAELLTLHSFETRTIKEDGRGKTSVLDIDLLPNRSDCFSHFGIARECAAIMGLKIKKYEPETIIKRGLEEFVELEIKEKDFCPRYIAVLIKGVKVRESSPQIKEMLLSCGTEPINNIVDAANYAMLETGNPIHIFDFDKIGSCGGIKKKITVRFAKDDEKIKALNGNEYSLDKNVLVIADQSEPLAIAGIKGGEKTAVNENTKNILIESANFEFRTIRKGSKVLNLCTDSSVRFEHGLDPNIAQIGAERTVELIKREAGGEIAGKSDICSKKRLPKKILFNIDCAENFLGKKISFQEISRILNLLGIKIKKISLKKILLEIPTSRSDLVAECDILEEILRIYGMNRIEPKIPEAKIIIPPQNKSICVEKKIRSIFKKTGFFESYNHSFIGRKDVKEYNGLVEIENPISRDFQYLRPSLIFGLVKNIEKNKGLNFNESTEASNIKIFEIGTIFFKKSLNFFEEKAFAGILFSRIAKNNPVPSFSLSDENSFSYLKGLLEIILDQLNIRNYQWKKNEKDTIFQKNASAEIIINGKSAGFVGRLSPKMFNNFKTIDKILALEINYGNIIDSAEFEKKYDPISKFPSACRDISLLVPKDIKIGAVAKEIIACSKKEIKKAVLFDLYEGENIPKGKKNLAFRIIFQSDKKTLTGQEIDHFHQKIIHSLENKNWQVRK